MTLSVAFHTHRTACVACTKMQNRKEQSIPRIRPCKSDTSLQSQRLWTLLVSCLPWGDEHMLKFGTQKHVLKPMLVCVLWPCHNELDDIFSFTMRRVAEFALHAVCHTAVRHCALTTLRGSVKNWQRFRCLGVDGKPRSLERTLYLPRFQCSTKWPSQLHSYFLFHLFSLFYAKCQTLYQFLNVERSVMNCLPLILYT